MCNDDIARRRAEGERPIIDQIRELVGDPYASVTIVLDEQSWNFDDHEGNAAYEAEMLTQAGLNWNGIEIAELGCGIGRLHGPGTIVHSGDQLLYPIDYEAEEELERLLDMLNKLE